MSPPILEILNLFCPNVVIISGVRNQNFSELEEIWTVVRSEEHFFRKINLKATLFWKISMPLEHKRDSNSICERYVVLCPSQYSNSSCVIGCALFKDVGSSNCSGFTMLIFVVNGGYCSYALNGDDNLSILIKCASPHI